MPRLPLKESDDRVPMRMIRMTFSKDNIVRCKVPSSGVLALPGKLAVL
jgi:hypothetical protein